jgi:hypothetical protein
VSPLEYKRHVIKATLEEEARMFSPKAPQSTKPPRSILGKAYGKREVRRMRKLSCEGYEQ